MTVKIILFFKLLVVLGTIFIKVDNVGIVKVFGKRIHSLDHTKCSFIVTSCVGRGEGDKEELCIGADFLVTADNCGIVS